MPAYCDCKGLFGLATCKRTHTQESTSRGSHQTHSNKPQSDSRFRVTIQWSAGVLPKAWRRRDWKIQGGSESTSKNSTTQGKERGWRFQKQVARSSEGWTTKAWKSKCVGQTRVQMQEIAESSAEIAQWRGHNSADSACSLKSLRHTRGGKDFMAESAL